MKKNPSIKRWEIAQDSEKSFWETYSTPELIRIHEEAYIREINFFSKIWGKFIKLDNNTKILQIGCGPLDMINYIKKGDLYSTDPLAETYKEKFDIDYTSTRLINAPGENLPYKDNFFDMVILANVLDHTSNPEKVLSECKRVLKPQGILHFECVYYQRSFLLLAKIYGFFKKIFTGEMFNINHPHMLILPELKKLVMKDFKIYEEKIGENVAVEAYDLKQFKKFRGTQKFTRSFPAKFNLLGNINYRAICKK